MWWLMGKRKEINENWLLLMKGKKIKKAQNKQTKKTNSVINQNLMVYESLKQ